jgi:hypothetical protein
MSEFWEEWPVLLAEFWQGFECFLGADPVPEFFFQCLEFVSKKMEKYQTDSPLILFAWSPFFFSKSASGYFGLALGSFARNFCPKSNTFRFVSCHF